MKKNCLKLMSVVCALLMLFGAVFAAGAEGAAEAPKGSRFLTEPKVFEETFSDSETLADLNAETMLGAVTESAGAGGLTLTEATNKAAVVKLFDYAPSTVEGSAYTVVLRGSMSAAASDKDESKDMLGIAFNILDENSYCYAVLRSSGNYDINRQKDGKWQSGPGYTTGNGSSRNRMLSFFEYQPDTGYELMIRVYSDGKVRLILDGVVTVDIADNFREGTGIGLYLRNTSATVTYLGVFADAANSSEDDKPGSAAPVDPENPENPENPDDQDKDKDGDGESETKPVTKPAPTPTDEKPAETTGKTGSGKKNAAGCAAEIGAGTFGMMTAAAALAVVLRKKRKEDGQ